MRELIWKLIARVVTIPVVKEWLVQRHGEKPVVWSADSLKVGV